MIILSLLCANTATPVQTANRTTPHHSPPYHTTPHHSTPHKMQTTAHQVNKTPRHIARADSKPHHTTAQLAT